MDHVLICKLIVRDEKVEQKALDSASASGKEALNTQKHNPQIRAYAPQTPAPRYPTKFDGQISPKRRGYIFPGSVAKATHKGSA
jgi:hypothetical protein